MYDLGKTSEGPAGLSTEALIEEARKVAWSTGTSDHAADVLTVMASRLESAINRERERTNG